MPEAVSRKRSFFGRGKENPQVEIKGILGIDLGLEHFATLASEKGIEEIANRQFLKNDLKRLKYLSRRLSKKTHRIFIELSAYLIENQRFYKKNL